MGYGVKAGAWSAVVLATVVGSSACKDKSSNVAPAPVATALASSEAPTSPTPTTLKLVVAPDSKTSIDMPAPHEHIKAETTAADGSLDVDVANLAESRGTVNVDLTSLVTNTFTSESNNRTQTVHARTWLEVADGEDGKLPDDLKTANRYARFAIRSIDGIEQADLGKIPSRPVPGSSDTEKSVRMTVHGELLLHGHKVTRDVPIEATFRYAQGALVDKPASVHVRSLSPLHVVLAEHDVKPRDGFGKIAKGAFLLLGTKVAEAADVSLDLWARP